MNNNGRTLYSLKPNEGTATYMQAILCMLIFQMVIAIVADALNSNGIELSNSMQLLLMAGIQIVYVVVVLLNVKIKIGAFVKTTVRRPNAATLLMPILIGVVSLFAFMGLNVLFESFLEYIEYNSNVGFEIKTALDVVLAVIVTVICAPIGEELVFRGALMFGLRKCGKWIAITLAALAFALMHMNPQQTFYQFAVGFVCGMVAWESRSILPAMVLHATNNLLAILLTVNKPFNDLLVFLFYGKYAVLSIIGAVIVGAVIVYLLCRLLGRLSVKDSRVENKAIGGKVANGDNEANGDKVANGDNEANSDELVAERNLYYHPVDVPNPYGAMGKISSRVFYIAGIVMCVIMWVSVFAMSLMPVGV